MRKSGELCDFLVKKSEIFAKNIEITLAILNYCDTILNRQRDLP
jgi:hypothetical protein